MIPTAVHQQSGIVDCTPREDRKFERKVLAKLDMITILKKNVTKFFRKYRDYRLTRERKYKYYLKEIKKSFDPIPVYTIGILNASDNFEELVPGIKSKIKTYNQILKKNSNFIDSSIVTAEGIMDDHHHLNKIGHEQLFTKLKEVIMEIKGKK